MAGLQYFETVSLLVYGRVTFLTYMCSFSRRCTFCATVVHGPVHSCLHVRWLISALEIGTEAILIFTRKCSSTWILFEIANDYPRRLDVSRRHSISASLEPTVRLKQQRSILYQIFTQNINSEGCVQHGFRDGRRCPGECYPNTNPNNDDVSPFSRLRSSIGQSPL
jgi:hypothetical protein